MKIIFFGTPKFAILTLQAIIDKGFDVVGVVTQEDQPSGRGLKTSPCPVKIFAKKLGLNVISLDQIKNADVGVVVAYGKIIPKKILDIFPHGVLNIHPSLLPKYRGPSPIQTAILNGDKEIGISIMLLDEEMDSGPIISQTAYKVKNESSGELLNILFQKGARLLVDILPDWVDGKIKREEQNHKNATITKKLTREDGKIDWTKPATEIERMVRAFDPWPGTWTIWKNKRVKILKVSVGNKKDNLVIDCGKGSLIIEKLQVEGKKPISGNEYVL